MRTQIKTYPYPVMCPWNNDVEPYGITFSCDVQPTADYYNLHLNIAVNNLSLKEHLDNNSAKAYLHIECKTNFYRKIIEVNYTGNDSKQIPTDELSGKVEIAFIICANNNLDKYHITGQHEDYEGMTFSINKGDVLALSDTHYFHAEKIPDPLKKVSSFLTIKNSGEKEINPAEIDYENNKITVSFCESEYNKYTSLLTSNKFGPTFSALLLMPILIDIIYNWPKDDDNQENLNQFKWFRTIAENARQKNIDLANTTEDPFVIAQKLFEFPYERCLNELTRYIEEE